MTITWNACRVKIRMIHVAMQVHNSVLDKAIIIFWNVMVHRFPIQSCTIERIDSVRARRIERKKRQEISITFVLEIVLALINDNDAFRQWTENRHMPHIEYFSVPLDKKNTGNNHRQNITKRMLFISLSLSLSLIN
jgi:hypothetical protein